MVDIISKEIKLNLLNDDKFEIGSIDDADLMRVICFGTHEGVNLNKTEFPREVLLNSYKSFIDKPLVLLPNLFGEPTGHGFNFKTLHSIPRTENLLDISLMRSRVLYRGIQST